jgi:hypothetical protein
MKRYKREPKRYDLTFEDGDLDGFECSMRGVSLERFVEITVLSSTLETPEGRTPENIERQFTILGELLVSWNLDDEHNQPVPCTYDGLKKQDFSFVMAILKGWMTAVASVPKASDDDLSSGATSPERSLGLVSQSQSQAS